jgi:hypothetical protein
MLCAKKVDSYCYVKLTEFGRNILEADRCKSIAYGGIYLEPLVTDLGTRFQLWKLMQIFGPALNNGDIHVPFENNEIKFEF